MSIIELKNVSRWYMVEKQKKTVLKNVSLSFPNKGLISILGKSGCGKSTLLNLIGGIDKISEGSVIFNNTDISKLKGKKKILFRNKMISYIFQNYHLLEDQTAIFNVMLPALISGDSYKTAYSKAKTLLNDFEIDKSLFNKRCADLSGGEKERIAILRSLINKPKIILADEPTGALDKHNALLTMEALKRLSLDCLVIMVTHNAKLAHEYSDRIIKMSDGQIIETKEINKLSVPYKKQEDIKIKTNNQWLNKIVTHNFLKRFKRNLFSITALVVGLVSSVLIFGFINGKRASITKSMENQFDYGTASISKENKLISADSPIALIQTMRPSYEEMQDLKETCTDFHICYSYDALISPFPSILINEQEIENISYTPVYSFIDDSANKSLLIKGKFPAFDTLNQVVINQYTYRLLNKKLKYDSLGTYIRIKETQSYSFPTGEIDKPYVTDYFAYDRTVQIVGVVNEIEFLNSPKIFYSYVAMDEYVDEYVLNNLSTVVEKTTWKDQVLDSPDNEALSGYSCRIFLKDHKNIASLRNIKNVLKENLSVTCNGLTVEETIFSLVDAASVGMGVFLAIALVGIVLILSIISFASYSEDTKDSAIMLCYGASHDQVALIYVFESIMIGLVSVTLSFVIGLLISKPMNLLIEKYTSLISSIDIPMLRFHNHTLLFPFLIVISTMLICVLATYLPIGFSKKISLKEELKTND